MIIFSNLRITYHIVILTGLISLLTSCSSTRFIYTFIDEFIKDEITYFLKLDEDEKVLLNKQVSEMVNWHRTSMLPRYSDYLNNIANKLENDEYSANDISKLMANGRFLIEETVIGLVPYASKFLIHHQTSESIDYMEKRMLNRRQERIIELSKSQDILLKERLDRLTSNSVDWPTNERPPWRNSWVSRTSIHKYREPNFQSSGGEFWNAAITGGSVNAQSHSPLDNDWFKVELVNSERKDFHLWFSADNQGVEDTLCEWNIQYYSPDQKLLLDTVELVSISGRATAHESKTLESIKPGVLDSLDAVFVQIFPSENNFCDIPYRINFAAKKAKAEIPADTYSDVLRWDTGSGSANWWHQNDLASGPLKLFLDETENSFWKEKSYMFFDKNNVSATQVLTIPISYFSENQIWVKNLFYDNKQYDLSLLLSYNESNELVLTVNSVSESAREMDGITPALEGMLLFVPYFRYGQAVYRMTLELVDTKALKFKLNEIEQRY